MCTNTQIGVFDAGAPERVSISRATITTRPHGATQGSHGRYTYRTAHTHTHLEGGQHCALVLPFPAFSDLGGLYIATLLSVGYMTKRRKEGLESSNVHD